ncbi:MAG: histidine phosphatase family protein [Paracoccaceae bacterium]
MLRHADRFGAQLSAAGRARAARLPEALADLPIDAIYTTPRQRNIDTATPLARARGSRCDAAGARRRQAAARQLPRQDNRLGRQPENLPLLYAELGVAAKPPVQFGEIHVLTFPRAVATRCWRNATTAEPGGRRRRAAPCHAGARPRFPDRGAAPERKGRPDQTALSGFPLAFSAPEGSEPRAGVCTCDAPPLSLFDTRVCACFAFVSRKTGQIPLPRRALSPRFRARSGARFVRFVRTETRLAAPVPDLPGPRNGPRVGQSRHDAAPPPAPPGASARP